MTKPKIGFALGSGGARGWAHIGVLRALEERGIVPDMVCGTSMGALVGAAYVSGNLDALEEWALSITTAKLAMMVDVSLNSGGLVEAKQVTKFFQSLDMPEMIEDQKIPFMTIATDMRTGREVWLREGGIIPAVRASISLPGIISPHEVNGRWLLDGGVTNPLPVSACRALGADIVIAVNPEAKHLNEMWKEPTPAADATWEAIRAKLPVVVRGMVDIVTGSAKKKTHKPPNYFDVVATSIDIMVDQTRRSRLIGEPPHVLLDVHLDDFSVLDLNRAGDAITAGRDCVARAHNMLDEVLPAVTVA